MAAGAPATSAAQQALLEDAGLTRREGGLCSAGVPLRDIAQAVGTPTFVYNAEIIRQQYGRLQAALGSLPHRICYAVKANSNLAVLRVLRDLGAGADLVSGGELARALAAGFAPEQLVFSGVGKTTAELQAAIAAGVGHVNVESLEELDRLARLAEDAPRPVAVGLRVNPAVTADTHPYISTGQRGIKFGIPTDQVLAAAERISRARGLRLTALAMHLGSQLVDPAPYVEGTERLLALLDQLRSAGQRDLAVLDVGGGLGIRYAESPGMEPADLVSAIRPLVEPTGLTLFLEPGRFLTGSAGLLLTEVLYRKHSGGKDFVVVDAGMNDFLRPSLYMAHHEIVEVQASAGPTRVVDVVGPVCETGDFFALDRCLPNVATGDHLAILGAGAYGFVMSSNYNSRPRAAEVVVDRGRFGLARAREDTAQLFAGESPDPLGR